MALIDQAQASGREERNMAAGVSKHPILQLLGCFEMTNGEQAAHLPFQAQRLVCYLAVTGSRANRHDLAGRLWPFTNRARAEGNLRTALWRVRKEVPDALESSRQSVGLGATVVVDYHELLERPLYSPRSLPAFDELSSLRLDLLPGWDEEWLIVERERLRQLRLRRLEALSSEYRESGNISSAIDAAYAAIEIEPLRETAHLALIEAHGADGNMAEALRQVRLVTGLLRERLGIEPCAAFQLRVEGLGLARS